jgi:hypothetical protein
MTAYRKKPVTVEVSDPLTDANMSAVATWCGGDVRRDAEMDADGWTTGDRYILIRTLEGVMKAQWGDRVIKGVQGEFYPCKPDIFDATYEPVSGEPT